MSCILTVIKDEHEYLDEWINYHLSIGVSHIFIFEDIDSKTHEDITEKYKDKVSLNRINAVLNNTQLKEAEELKISKRYSAQVLYFKNAIKYIKNNFSNKYKWCFIIDVDEFITLENDNDIKNILSSFESYDAFIMKWQCYGADGHIKKPNYENTGVIETFKKEVDGNLIEQRSCLCKICFNIHTYNDSFFYNPHYPTYKCNWCNTDFIKDNIKTSYKNIYLRHYITKSWEEYVWKKLQRGFIWGKRRNLDTFFDLNSDLNFCKRELIEQLEDKNKEILVILPYVQSKAQGKEIEICLNGWKNNCQFKYHFVVVGEFDNLLVNKYPWVEFIPYKNKEKIDGQYNPHLDIINKMDFVLKKYENQYNGFIAMCDDIYAIKPFELNDILSTHYHSTGFIGNENAPKSYWIHDKWKTRQLLDKENLPHINYTTHFPYWYEISKLKEIWDKFNMRNESYTLEDVYFNYFTHEKPILDSKIRFGVWNKDVYYNRFNQSLNDPNIKFMCNSVEGWCVELEKDLNEITNINK